MDADADARGVMIWRERYPSRCSWMVLVRSEAQPREEDRAAGVAYFGDLAG